MAKIEIPDSMVPDGMLIDDDREVTFSIANGMATGYITVCVPVRRKPRLKRIVFTVAGEPRIIQSGEWYTPDGVEVRCAVCFTSSRYHPLTRTEEYE